MPSFTPCHRLSGKLRFAPPVRLTRKYCIGVFQKIWLEHPRATNEEFRLLADRHYPSDANLFRGKKQKIWGEELEKFLAEVNRAREFSRA